MAESADARVSKTRGLRPVRVRPPLPARATVRRDLRFAVDPSPAIIDALIRAGRRWPSIEPMEPAPPRAPLSIRVWGWVLLVSAVLNLIGFFTSTLGTLASGHAPGLSATLMVAFLVSLATGIGFVSGWRWSWYSGLMVAVGGLVFGTWYLAQIPGPGASEIRPALGVIWLGPSLLLLLCLLFPASIRWMRGGEQPWRWPMPPPGASAATPPPHPLAEVAPARPSLILPLAIFLLAGTAAGLILWLARGGGEFPDRAAGFRLTRTMDAHAGMIFGPPVTMFPDPAPEAIVHRLAVYQDGDVTAEVRLFEVDLSRWPHETLLVSAGVSVGTGRITAEAVDGVTYTCARVPPGAACVWTDGAWTGWARSDGPIAVDRLRDLASAAQSAVT
jgi:hypothetical protein